MSKSFITSDHLKESIQFAKCVKQAQAREKILTEVLHSMNESQRKDLGYLKLNNHRTQRILKTYFVSPELQKIITQIEYPQTWLVLSEDWCGDSAQVLPVVAKIAELNPLVSLRILSRDNHLDLMDFYLTNGKRSIPKLIAIDNDFNELFQWGPRPPKAAEIFSNSLELGISKNEAYKKMHSWYAKDKGKSIEAEFAGILSRMVIQKEQERVL